jgi:hypothetical protein
MQSTALGHSIVRGSRIDSATTPTPTLRSAYFTGSSVTTSAPGRVSRWVGTNWMPA